MVKTIKCIFNYFGICLFIYAILILLIGPYWAKHATLNDELPLGRVYGIIVSNSGNIYLGSQTYSRIQIYDNNGNFLRGLFLPGCDPGGQPYKFSLSHNESEIIVSDYNNNLVLNAKTGKILERTNASLNIDSSNSFYGASGAYYKLINSFLIWPRVRRVAPTGEENIVVSQPWTLWIRQGTLFSPAGLIVLLGILIVLSAHISDIRRQFRQSVGKFRKNLSNVSRGVTRPEDK